MTKHALQFTPFQVARITAHGIEFKPEALVEALDEAEKLLSQRMQTGEAKEGKGIRDPQLCGRYVRLFRDEARDLHLPLTDLGQRIFGLSGPSYQNFATGMRSRTPDLIGQLYFAPTAHIQTTRTGAKQYAVNLTALARMHERGETLYPRLYRDGIIDTLIADAKQYMDLDGNGHPLPPLADRLHKFQPTPGK